MGARATFFRYSRFDALPALGGVIQVAFLLWTIHAFSTLSWPALVATFLVVTFAYCWNLQCVSHNFIHNPFFRSAWLNRAYGVLETLAIGMPHILYHHYHLNHHAGDNDKKGPDGTTRDWSSIFRYGKGDAPEAFWRYCLVSFFRVEVGPVVRVAIRHGREHIRQMIGEIAVLAAFWVYLACLHLPYFLCFYLPSFFLGWVVSYAEGYLEHYGAQPGNPFANSVSSYNRLYNLLWFNNGYHQEHHWDPKRHWTQMKVLHEEIRPQLEANHTRTLRGPHLTALIEDFFTRRPPQPAVETRQRPRRAA
jgi:fatty acid desaturase